MCKNWLTRYGLFVQKRKCKTYLELITKCKSIFKAYIWALHKKFMTVIDEVGMWRSKEKMYTKRPLHFCKILVYGQRLVMVTRKFFCLINLKIPWLYFGILLLRTTFQNDCTWNSLRHIRECFQECYLPNPRFRWQSQWWSISGPEIHSPFDISLTEDMNKMHWTWEHVLDEFGGK